MPDASGSEYPTQSWLLALMPTVLITGIAGFTGRYMAGALRREGYQVIGVTTGKNCPEQGIFRCDLMDRAGLASIVEKVQPDCAVHLAAISFAAHGEAETTYQTNIVGTRNLLEALANNSKTLHSVLLASSASIYGNSPADPIDESMPPMPENDYAISKLAMEYMARLWADRLPITIVRPFNYTGVGQSLNFLLPKIVDHFKRGAPKIELGNLDVSRDFSDIRMLVTVYCKLLQRAPAGKVFNVCSEKAHTLLEILAMMAEIAGYEIAVQVNPAFVRNNEVKRLRGSNAKLVVEIGSLDVIPLDQTLRWMFSCTDAAEADVA